MEIISFEKRAFEEVAAKLDYFVQRVDNLCRMHGEKNRAVGWTTVQSAKNCVSVRGHCRHFGTTELLLLPKSGTGLTIVPKMWSKLL